MDIKIDNKQVEEIIKTHIEFVYGFQAKGIQFFIDNKEFSGVVVTLDTDKPGDRFVLTDIEDIDGRRK